MSATNSVSEMEFNHAFCDRLPISSTTWPLSYYLVHFRPGVECGEFWLTNFTCLRPTWTEKSPGPVNAGKGEFEKNARIKLARHSYSPSILN